VISPAQLAAKRIFDLLLSSASLLVLSPAMVLIALAVRLTSKGPVFYIQPRVGRGGRLFNFIKFRTMVVGAQKMGAGINIEKNDPRITPVGEFLRRYSLDELPQLINILKGEMSLVGPRPTLQYQVEQYDERQRGRLAVPPGLTGWAQIHGRNNLSWDERIEMDLWYIDHYSFPLDLRIILGTFAVVIAGEGVYGKKWEGRSPEEWAARKEGEPKGEQEKI
jgi:exopolysaccharide biosynthesis polyprenyl glycosylphosphotransferase